MWSRPLSKRIIIIIIILSVQAVVSKNKNIDYRVKETYSIMSTKVTCETDISLLVI